jgi:serine/threonine protein kinase
MSADAVNPAGTDGGTTTNSDQQLPLNARQRYTKVRAIGQGANGTAWLCTDNQYAAAVDRQQQQQQSSQALNESTQRYVVVKIFTVPQMSTKERNLVQNEINCLSTARHPNIISFYEASIEDVSDLPHGAVVPPPSNGGSPQPAKQLIVMEFADAGDLRRIIKMRRNPTMIAPPTQPAQAAAQHRRSQQLPPQPQFVIDPNAFFTARDVMFLFVQIAMAVHHCHCNSILHRDIKTANIMMCSNGLVKLGDFGLSRRYEKAVPAGSAPAGGCSTSADHPPLDVSSATSIAQTFCGTPCYLAPELWKGQKYGKAADIWGLGIVLYEMVTLGSRPFNGDSVHVLANCIVSGVYDPLPAQGALGSQSVDDGIRALVETLLDVDPARRPSTTAIFQMPYVRKCLMDLSGAMKRNPSVPADVLTTWQREADKLLELPVQLTQLPALPETHAGFVRRYVASAASTQWILHELRLVRGGAALVLATVQQQQQQQEALTIGGGYFPHSLSPQQQMKEIPTSQLSTVMAIPVESSFGIPGVFAVTTIDGRCTWFQAQSDGEQKQWVRLLRNAITAASALSSGERGA